MSTPRYARAARIALLAAALASAGAMLAGCQDPAALAEARASAERDAAEAAAAQAATDFDAAFAAGNWPLAAAHGDVLLARWPGTEAAERIQPRHEEARAKGNAVREEARLAALWAYNAEPVKGGSQLSAAIFSQHNVDSDGSGAKPVRLIFRDHPEWGRCSYLVMQAGDFDCYGACRVAVTIDDAAPVRMAANRPDTDEAIAMFIDDEKALWRMIDGARQLRVEYPVKAGGTRAAEFEVAGLDPTQLPAWN